MTTPPTTHFEFGYVVLVPFLIKPSVLKPVLTTIEKGLVIKKLGRLAAADQGKLREGLAAILG